MTTRVPANIDVVPPFTGTGVGPFVGGDTALVTSDGNTSYVEVTDSGFGGGVATSHTFTWEPGGPISPTAVVTIEADWFTGDIGGFRLGFIHPDLGGRAVGEFVTAAGAGHAYGDTQRITVPAVWVADGAAFAPGVEWDIVGYSTDLFLPCTTRITRLTMSIGERIPLRQLHRDDGQGVTPPRAFGGASRIRTGRAYGYD